MSASRVRLALAAFAAVLVVVLAGGCTDEDIERSIGKQTAAAIESSYKMVDDPLVADYVDTMGHILVGHAKRQDIPYEFKVIDTDIVNAAAVPWGHVYLTSGLLDFVDSEDELWAVTGHEIGHQVGRDSVKAVKENVLLSIATILIGRETRLGGDLADLGSDLFQLKHSRVDEAQADDYSIALIYAAGYDPTAQARFFERLMKEIEKDHPSRLETLFLTHPPTKDRIERQGQKPEVALADAKALAQVGAGYARRARYAEAIEKLSQAVELDGSNVAARLLLADCHRVRGEREQAAEQYAAVLRVNPDLVSAQEGLREAQTEVAAPVEVAASSEDLVLARTGIARASVQLEAAAGAASTATEGLPRNLRPVADALERSTTALVETGNRMPELPDTAREIAVTTGLAIADANESVYCLEQMHDDFGATMAKGTRVAETAGRLADGPLTADQAAILIRSARQLGTCADEIQGLAGEMPPLVRTVENTGRVAENAATRLNDALLPGSTLTDRQIAVDSVKLSQQRGERTREKTREAALRAARARTRSLVAEISTAGLVLGPTRALACDNLVAYYTQADVATARRVREQNHLGLGEAALLLAGAKSSQRSPDSLLGLAGDGRDYVAAADHAGADLTHVNLFLRFIADALAKEASG